MAPFIKRPVQSSVLKNLQGIAFVDIGSAWAGLLPGGENSQAPNYIFPNGSTASGYNQPMVLQLNVPGSSGWCASFGLGMRTTLLGYYLRLDRTWNIEKQKMWLISMGTDF